MPKKHFVAIGAVIALVAAFQPAQAQRSAQCVAGPDGRNQLKFNIKPSMVVHDKVLDVKQGELGLGGNAGESVFSFRRTIQSILQSAGAPTDQNAQVAFLKTMLDSFKPAGELALNAKAGIFMPFDEREEASELNPADMLNESSAQAMRPLALFNRFDLAPDNWTHCGEHRIVYGKVDPQREKRMLLIFEAVVPNPNVAAGEAGCRRVTEFWAGLSGPDASTDLEKARRLSEFYYGGKTGHPDGNLLEAVVSFRNYGGDANRGQIRANAFMQQPWQLREWLTQLTFAESGPAVAFVPVTVKDNPLAQLYQDGFATNPDILPGNIPAAVANLHGEFIQALTSTIAPRLLSETTEKHRKLATDLQKFDLGAGPHVSEATILLNTIALGNDDKFNEHQSVSQGEQDVPGEPADASKTVRALVEHVGGQPSAQLPRQGSQIILNRATASTCGGCHNTAVGDVVREIQGGSTVTWPAVVPGGFVHVHETTRELSPALEQFFLPVRRYILGRHLCGLQPPSPPQPEDEAYARFATPPSGVSLEVVANSPRFVDTIVEQYLAEADRPRAAQLTSQGVGARIGALTAPEREALRIRVQGAIDAARQIEQARPGAFVQTRRPH